MHESWPVKHRTLSNHRGHLTLMEIFPPRREKKGGGGGGQGSRHQRSLETRLETPKLDMYADVRSIDDVIISSGAIVFSQRNPRRH